MKRRVFIIMVLAGLTVLWLVARSYIFPNPSNVASPGTAVQNKNAPLPTPFEFSELSVYFLRSKTYKSTLGEMEKYSENSGYSAYLTKYTSDGFNINGMLTVPKGKKPPGGWPAIVFVHGYIPPKQYETMKNYFNYVDTLAAAGFVVFKIDLRGHGTSEGEATGAYYSSDYVIDVLNAVEALKSDIDLNPQKIGLWGHSMAGNIILRAFVVKPQIPAVVIWAGAGTSYTGLTKYGISDASFQPSQISSERLKKRQRLMALYGQPNEKSAFWRQVDPVYFLSELKGRLQLHHSADDTVVNIAYSRDINALLDRTLVPHEFYEYANGGHNISGESFNVAMKRSIEFFRKM